MASVKIALVSPRYNPLPLSAALGTPEELPLPWLSFQPTRIPLVTPVEVTEMKLVLARYKIPLHRCAPLPVCAGTPSTPTAILDALARFNVPRPERSKTA